MYLPYSAFRFLNEEIFVRVKAFQEADRSDHVQFIQWAGKLQWELQAARFRIDTLLKLLPIQLRQKLFTGRLVDLQDCNHLINTKRNRT
jgi:hypothetical protein